jgi:putative PIN family toxin of toxin-antitoxin system
MSVYQVVIDTNVFITALASQRGASYKLLSLINNGKYQINLSVPLTLEYEAIAKRMAGDLKLTESDIDNILDYMIGLANHWKIHYLWRPLVKDPGDDMLLELAVTAGCEYIITYNIRDFKNIEPFGIKAITPKEFLTHIGELP